MDDETAITMYQPRERMTLNQAIAGWLDEKKGASGSSKTLTTYSETLLPFRAVLQATVLDLDAEPAIVAPIAQGWAGARQSSPDGRKPRTGDVAPATYNQRLAILSSFYEYAIRHEVLSYNPIERVKRRKTGKKDAARPREESQVKAGLQQIDRSTLEGMRDYALLSVALATGRRVSELAGLRYKHLHKHGDSCIIEWERCKGNKQMTDELKGKTTRALYAYLHAIYGARLAQLAGDTPVWISLSN